MIKLNVSANIGHHQVFHPKELYIKHAAAYQCWDLITEDLELNVAYSLGVARAVLKLFFLQGKAPKEIHAILTETLTCFLPGRA